MRRRDAASGDVAGAATSGLPSLAAMSDATRPGVHGEPGDATATAGGPGPASGDDERSAAMRRRDAASGDAAGAAMSALPSLAAIAAAIVPGVHGEPGELERAVAAGRAPAAAEELDAALGGVAGLGGGGTCACLRGVVDDDDAVTPTSRTATASKIATASCTEDDRCTRVSTRCTASAVATATEASAGSVADAAAGEAAASCFASAMFGAAAELT